MERAKVMLHKFSGPKIKIDRARKHLAELEKARADFRASRAKKCRTEISRSGGTFTFNFQMDLSGPPEDFGAIVGDIIHNLRAALDLAACELVRAVGQSDKGVYFPFSQSESDLDKTIKVRHFDRAGPDAVALLKKMNLVLKELVS